MKITAAKIYEAIKARHNGPGWAVLAEAPITTGIDNRRGYIDAYAIGLWSSNRGFIAYEIKISRQDFLNDLSKFQQKQKIALKNSTQFYYAAPYGLLKPDEMPEDCGLLEVQDGRTIISKAAPARSLNAMDTRFIAAILRAALQTREVESKHAWHYLDSVMTLEDLIELARKEGFIYNKHTIDERVEMLTGGKGTISDQALHKVAIKLGVMDLYGGIDSVANAVIEKIEKLDETIALKRTLDYMRDDITIAANSLIQLQEKLNNI